MNHNARKVKKLHRVAMEFADQADLAKLFGEREKFLRLTEQAFEREKAAADLMADIHVEPSRGVLHRSAATLAWRCGLYDEAEKLIYRALSGNPRSDIEWELKDLLGTVNLAKSGIHLGEGQLQLSLHGNAIGHGKAAIEEFSSRAPSISTMLRISAKSALRKAQDVASDKTAEIGDIPVFLEGLEAGSCIVNLRLGEATQEVLPGFERFNEAIAPFLDNLDILERDHLGWLQDDLADPTDYRDFVKAATKLAPDGEKVSTVKFQAIVGDHTRVVSLSRRRDYLEKIDIPIVPIIEARPSASDEDIHMSGMLKVANGLNNTECVLVADDNINWAIEGPVDIMDDMVRAYFNRRVEIRGKRMKGKNRLRRIHVSSLADVRLLSNVRESEPSQAPPAFLLEA